MSTKLLAVTPENFEAAVLLSTTPVLLDLWAGWCAPCRAIAPTLDRLSAEYGSALQIANLDVERYPEMMAKFGVRGIPALILFQGGAEASRKTGVQTGEQLRRWLTESGIVPAADAKAPDVGGDAAEWGAFYGDAELRAFLLARVARHAANGAIQVSRFPYWHEGKGTVSAALVHSANPKYFERIAGMPFSMAAALEMACPTEVDQICRLMDTIAPGADLRRVPVEFAKDWLKDGAMDWRSIASNADVDALRMQWVTLVGRQLAGLPVEASAWTDLVEQIRTVKLSIGASLVGPTLICDLLKVLSPPPAPHDTAWAYALLGLGAHAIFLAMRLAEGWSHDELDMENVRHAWFLERESHEPGKKFTPDRLTEAHKEWAAANSAYQSKEAQFNERVEELFSPFHQRLQSSLISLVAAAPQSAASS